GWYSLVSGFQYPRMTRLKPPRPVISPPSMPSFCANASRAAFASSPISPIKMYALGGPLSMSSCFMFRSRSCFDRYRRCGGFSWRLHSERHDHKGDCEQCREDQEDPDQGRRDRVRVGHVSQGSDARLGLQFL